MDLMADMLAILKLNIQNWVFVSVLLIFIEFINFLLVNEIVRRPRIVYEEFGFGAVKRFLFTDRPWYTVLCRTIRNFLIMAALAVVFFMLIAAAEFAYPDFSTLMERSTVIIRMMRTGCNVVMLAMSVDIYETSSGKRFPMLAPFWMFYLFPLNMFVVGSFIYKNWYQIYLIMCFCIFAGYFICWLP